MMNPRISRARFLSLLIVFPLVFVGLMCSSEGPPVLDDVEGDVTASDGITCTDEGGTLQLNCPFLPNTNLTAQPDYDYFAWNAFIAMNWPAIDPSSANGYTRGIADTTKSFITALPSDPTVWETLKEKREIFFPDTINGQPSTLLPDTAWNQDFSYGPLIAAAEANPCSASDTASLHLARRTLAQGSKLFFDILDETAEVASEALETQTQLCGGYIPSDSVATVCANPDSFSQYDTTCCSVPGQKVGPRVWLGTPADNHPVLYEVKANYDYWEYVVADSAFNVEDNATRAAADGITLPARTSADKFPGKTNPGVTQYSSSTCRSMQPSLNHPCKAGSVQIKTAWIQIDQDELDDYHWTLGEYFKNDANGDVCAATDTLGLVGIHIIQRIHTGALGDTTASVQGGTYIFATWEHTGITDGEFSYANYLTSNTQHTPYPDTSAALPLNRAFDILSSTQDVNTDVHNQLGCSGSSPPVWCNYQLIGTQFQAINVDSTASSPNDPTGIGQPAYLANLLVESNIDLQNFQGLPPGTTPISKYDTTLTTNSGSSYIRVGKANLPFNQYDQGFFNMGGCMGCHGVAQLNGYGFSFILLENQKGVNSIDTQQSFEIPPGGN